MDPELANCRERAVLSRALADVAVRGERHPERWRGYFERLLSGRTIGPLPPGSSVIPAQKHAIAGQCAFKLAPDSDELPSQSGAGMQELRQRLEMLKGQDVALGVDLSGISARRFAAWIDALAAELRAASGRAGGLPSMLVSVRAEHPGCCELMKAASSGTLGGARAALRVGAASFASPARWDELIEASREHPHVDLVLCKEQAPLTDLAGKESAEAVMPLSLFEAPADTAWLGMQFDLSTIPAEQIARGVPHLKKLVRVGVRLADNLIDAVSWPSGGLRSDARANRRLAAHVTGIGDLALRHGMNPAEPSTVATLQRWLSLFKRQLLRESLRLAAERGPYPALDAEQLVEALAPRYGPQRARRLIARRSPRHRQLLALSPYCVLPTAPTRIPARDWLNLLPVIRIADNLTMYGSEARSRLEKADYERLLRRTWALFQGAPGG